MEGNVIRCNDCNMNFTSNAVLNYHLVGKRHRKRLEVLKLSNVNNQELRCKICEINTNSLLQMQAHLTSAKHISKAQGIPVPNEKTLPSPKTKILENFPCNICNITMNSKSQYEAHIVSRKHKNKESGRSIFKKWHSKRIKGVQNSLSQNFVPAEDSCINYLTNGNIHNTGYATNNYTNKCDAPISEYMPYYHGAYAYNSGDNVHNAQPFYYEEMFK